jgi:hypothetical protein
MSKERALRRVAREAEEQAARAARARTVARRAKRRELQRRLTPALPKRRRVGKLFPRRSTSERAIIAIVFAVVLLGIWTLLDDTTTEIALTAIAVLVLPAAVVVAFGRRS